jgi:RHS repeat-associated protein
VRAVTTFKPLASGAAVSTLRREAAIYKPFGEMTEVLQPTQVNPEQKGWIGERYDADAGLQYLNARYYDPEYGFFLQPDWFEVTAAGVGTNRYSYSFNDPVNKMDPSGNYEEDVHRDLTEVIAAAAGASVDVAVELGAATQYVDDNPETSPMGMSPWGEAVQVRADYHFTTPERREQMKSNAEETATASSMGEYLHALQDSFSHDGYGPRLGHARAGHAPDKTFNDVEKADRMARATYDAIRDSEFGSVDKSISWDEISGAVHDFNAAESQEGKAKAIDELKSLIFD